MLVRHQGADLLRERVRKLLANLPRAIAGEQEPIHQVRVASRRLRVALPILARKPDGKRIRRLRRRLRRLIRAAGSSRDLDICVELFDERLADRIPGEEERVLRRRLVASRGRARRRNAWDLMGLDLARIRRDLKELLESEPEEIFIVMSRYRRSRDAIGDSILGELEGLGERFDPVRLHAVRRSVRRLRYVAEVGACFREETAGALKRFKALQEDLGRLHDATVLAGRLEAHAVAASRRGQERIAASARKLSRGSLEMARGLHRAFLLRGPADEIRRLMRLMGRSQSAA